MKKVYTILIGLFFLTTYSYSVQYSVFTAGEGYKYLQQNYNLKGWELSQAFTSWYPNDTTVIFDFVNGKSSFWYYTLRNANNNNDIRIWSFLLTKIDDQFSPLDFGIEDDEFITDLARLPKDWLDSDLLPMAVQANSNFGQYLMANFDKIVEFSVSLTPKYLTEEALPTAMWTLALDIQNLTDQAYCIFDATTLELFECYVPDISSIIIENSKALNCYPNPANDKIHFDIDHNGYVFVKVFNMEGNLVHSEIANSFNGFSLNLSNLPNGNYNVLSIINNKNYINKVAISR